MFLFIKEAVNNITKHADAKNVNMISKLVNTQFYLTIKDDGKGFHTNLKTTGNGLVSLKNRAEILRGKYTISSKVNEGTTIELQIRIP
ncbi:sensor histidine kinase [Polaribacter sp.]|uniref:sensor histidine kinase n=1 Tax=Polaribacter sp. TaxID=1920175 RepID=UPI003F6C3043